MPAEPSRKPPTPPGGGEPMPVGAVVGRRVVARACGCEREFLEIAGERFRDGRRAKFAATRCPACAARAAARHDVVPKREAFAMLPAGAVVALARRADGGWAGTLTAGGVTAAAAGPDPQPLVAALAQQWAAARPGGAPGSPPVALPGV